MAAGKLGPRRREAGIDLQAPLIEASRLYEVLVAAGQLVAAQIELVRARVARRPWHRRRILTPQRERERLHYPSRQIVLETKEIA
jgi:hypothetical protein